MMTNREKQALDRHITGEDQLKEPPDDTVLAPPPRTVIAMSMGYWGSHPYSGVGVGPNIAGAIKYAMKRLRKSGGSTAKGKMLLISAPPDAWIDPYGATCWNDPDNVHDRPYYIDRDGNRLAEQSKPMV